MLFDTITDVIVCEIHACSSPKPVVCLQTIETIFLVVFSSRKRVHQPVYANFVDTNIYMVVTTSGANKRK
jgi:hypothetical protein